MARLPEPPSCEPTGFRGSNELLDPGPAHLSSHGIQPVPKVDLGNRQNQCRKRGLTEMAGGLVPDLVGYGIASVAQSSRSLGQRQRGAFRIRVVGRLSPGT